MLARIARVVCALGAVVLSLSVNAQESGAPGSDKQAASEADLSAGTGFDYTAGKYGTKTTTKFLSVPVRIDYDTDEWGLGFAPSYAEQRAPAGGAAVGGRLVGSRIVAVNAPVKTTRGAGDTIGTVTRYLIEQERSGFSLDVMGQVKFATADHKKGLGTGKNDYSLQSDISRSFGSFLGLASVGYTRAGKPSGFQLRNFWYGSLDGSYKTGERVSLGLTYYAGQTATIGGPPQRDVTLHLDLKTAGGTHFNVYALKGLANGSPDRGVGASFTYFF